MFRPSVGPLRLPRKSEPRRKYFLPRTVLTEQCPPTHCDQAESVFSRLLSAHERLTGLKSPSHLPPRQRRPRNRFLQRFRVPLDAPAGRFIAIEKRDKLQLRSPHRRRPVPHNFERREGLAA